MDSSGAASVGGEEHQHVTWVDDGVEAALKIEDAVVEDDFDVLREELGVEVKEEGVTRV